MYIKQLHKAKHFIFGGLLLAFISPFICNWLCVPDSDGVNNSAQRFEIGDAAHQVSHHFGLDDDQRQNPTGLLGDKKMPSPDECCNSNQTNDTRIKYKLREFKLTKSPQLMWVFDFTEHIALQFHKTAFPNHRNDWLSSPKVPLRILHQSFLC